MLRITGVETLLVRQQHQQACAEQHGDLRCQGIVIAEGDLLGGCRVVLVDDRGNAPGEQRFERMSRIEVRLAAFEVACGQQHLSRCAIGTPECALPGLLQHGLANGGRGLQLGDRCRPLGAVECPDAECDGTRRDDAEGVVLGDLANLVGNPIESAATQAPIGIDQRRATELDDNGTAGHTGIVRQSEPEAINFALGSDP